MSTKSFLATSLFVLVIAWAAASRSAPEPALPALPELAFDPSGPEPITGEPVMPNPGSETKRPNPFKPYDTGGGDIAYEDLAPSERAVVDRGRDTRGWREVHDAYKTAVLEHVPRVRAQAAATRLGTEHLATIGVVP